MTRPILRLEFSEPTYAYWDGGKKSGGDFKPEGCREHPGKGHYIWWGCFYLNFRFTAKAGRSWKEAARAAQKRLCNLYRLPATVSVIWKEEGGKDVY